MALRQKLHITFLDNSTYVVQEGYIVKEGRIIEEYDGDVIKTIIPFENIKKIIILESNLESAGAY